MKSLESWKRGKPWGIWAYIGKEILLTFSVCFLFFFVTFFINQILYMAQDLMKQRAPLSQVLLLLVYAMPSFVALSVPFATLVGCLMSMGRLVSDNEILVMTASGLSQRRIFAPFLVIGILISLLSFAMNDVFMPLSTINFSKTYRNLMNSTPSLVLKPYSVTRMQNATIVTGRVEGNVVENAMIIDSGDGTSSRVITADKATLEDSGQGEGVISLTLDKVFVIETNQGNRRKYDYSSSDRMIYNILVKDIVEGTGGTVPSNMSSRDLAKIVNDKKKAFAAKVADHQKELGKARFALAAEYGSAALRPGATSMGAWSSISQDYQDTQRLSAEKMSDRTMLAYEREFHKKFAIPFGAAAFVLLAFPVGLLFRKSGRMVGLLIGLIVSFLYWVLMYGSDTIATRLPYSPFWMMWFPNILVIALAAGAVLIGRLRR